MEFIREITCSEFRAVFLEVRTDDGYPRFVTNPIQSKKWRLEMIEELAE